MAIGKLFGRKKKRKYPVKLDANGKSARQRCFEMFKDHVPFQEIAAAVEVKIETVYRYHRQWAKNPDLERYIAYYKWILNKSAPDRERTIDEMAQLLGISKEQIETILQQHHGLLRL